MQIPLAEVPTLLEAIQSARQQAVTGEVVVFSPGCASFDEFRNFEDRGAFFDRQAIIKG
jgi:UDP-N-acetylmuramoylalanine--D-glutamate ligase